MKNMPYFRFWVKDFETDENVRVLSLAEVGLYITALNHAWMNNGLPEDTEMLRRALKLSRAELKHHWPLVSRCFTADGHGRLRNKRQEEERDHAKKISDLRKTSASIRYSRETKSDSVLEFPSGNPSVCNEQPLQMQDACSTNDAHMPGSVYVSDPLVVELATETKTVSARADDFGTFLETCDLAEMRGSESDLRIAHAEWGTLSLGDKLAACQGIKDRVACGEYADPSYRHGPQNYLKNKIWQRPLRKRREPGIEKVHTHRREVAALSEVFANMRNA